MDSTILLKQKTFFRFWFWWIGNLTAQLKRRKNTFNLKMKVIIHLRFTFIDLWIKIKNILEFFEPFLTHFIL